MREVPTQSLQPMSFRTEFTIESFFTRLRQEGKLFGAKCKECNSRMVPPRPLCSRCLSSNLEWFEVPAEGELLAFSEVHVTNDSFFESIPYIVGIAKFANGLKIPAIIKGCEIKQLKVGARIRVETRKQDSSDRAEPTLKETKPAYWFTIA
jgi:uncharacterized OB-fold protein